MRCNKEEKTMWVEDWRQSGKSARAYAKENGINPQTFVNWTKQETASKGCFVEVPAQMAQPVHYAQEILIEKGEIKIHIPLSAESRELRAIFNALGGAV